MSTAALAAGVAAQSVNTVSDVESYAVYAALIPHEWPVTVAKATRIILRQETVANWGCVPKGRPLQDAWKPVVDDFVLQNARPRLLLAGFDLGVQSLLVPSVDIDDAFKNVEVGDWRLFYARYADSGGFIEVSAVGFDATKTHALVYIAHHCGGLCGGGTHHFVEKKDGQWVPANVKDLENCVWVS